VIKTRLVEVKGRKSIVSGQVEDLAANVLVEATLVPSLHTFADYISLTLYISISAMFVQPRYAKLLDSSVVKQVLGSPEEQPTKLDKEKQNPALH
jgi:hypothetical protein